MKLHQALVSHLQNKADDTAVVNVHNEHAPDSYIYRSIEDIAYVVADVIATDDPTTLARMVFFGDVESWYARFFALDGYANIYSFNWLTAVARLILIGLPNKSSRINNLMMLTLTHTHICLKMNKP